jgi:hypothetical protein
MIKRLENQSPLDYVLQSSGTIETLMSFLQNNKISYDEFYNKNEYDIKLQYNEIVNIYKKNKITIASRNFHHGDFNNDFNFDFFI